MKKYHVLLIIIFLNLISFNVYSSEKEYNRVVRRMEQRMERNYRPDDVANIDFFEFVFDSGTNIRFSAHIQGYSMEDPWHIYAGESIKISSETHAVSHYIAAKAFNLDSIKYFGRHGRGALIGICPYHTGLTFFPIADIVAGQRIEEGYNQSMVNDVRTFTLPVSADKRFFSTHVLDSAINIKDTVWNGIPCFALFGSISFEQTLSAKDSLKINNLGLDVSDHHIQCWNGSQTNKSQMMIISKSDYALLHYHATEEQFTKNHQKYECYKEANFHKIGKTYVLTNAYVLADRYHPTMGVFYGNGLKTMILISRSREQISLKNARTYDRRGAIGYERFCEPISKPTPLMIEMFNECINKNN